MKLALLILLLSLKASAQAPNCIELSWATNAPVTILVSNALNLPFQPTAHVIGTYIVFGLRYLPEPLFFKVTTISGQPLRITTRRLYMPDLPKYQTK